MKNPSYNRQLFKHDTKLDEKKVYFKFDECIVDQDFYGVDKEYYLELMPIERRLSSYLIPGGASDQVIFTTIVKAINGVASFLLGRKINIKFVEVEGENHATFDGKTVTLSLSPLFDHRVSLDVRVNTIIATGLHEIAHCLHTTPEFGRLLVREGHIKNKVSRLSNRLETIPNFDAVDKVLKNGLHKNLLNIVEDKRIERTLLHKRGGYVFYFDCERQYILWEKLNHYKGLVENPPIEDPLAKAVGEDNKVYAQLFEYVLLHVLMPEAESAFLDTVKYSKEFEQLVNKANDIVKGYASTFPSALDQATALLALFPENAQEALSKAMGNGDMEGKLMPGGGECKLSEEQKANIQALLEDSCDLSPHELKEVSKLNIPNGFRNIHNIETVPAEIKDFDQSIYTDAMKLSRQISNNLSFIDSRFNRTIESFEMRQGELDDDEIYSLGFNKDVFYEDEEAPGYSLDFGILIDESGSMHGEKIKNAQIAALAMTLALKNSKHINLTVYGHTANHTRNADITLYRYFDPMERSVDVNTLFSVKARSNNADGFAIAQMGEILRKGSSRMKVMVVISDGQPHANGYGGHEANSHVRSIVTNLEKEGMFVVQIAIESFDSASMFTNFIPYKPGDNLGQNLKKVLQKKLVEISNLI